MSEDKSQEGQLIVKDYEAYQLYERLKRNPILNAKSKIEVSDGRTLNLGMTVANLKRNIETLPPDEQIKILKLKQIYYDILCKRNGAQRKAFGAMVNGDSVVVKDKLDQLDTKKPELIELFGKMFTAKEVHQIILEQFKFRQISLLQVAQWRSKYLPEINIKIEEHKRSFSDIRLGYKRSRLEELSWMYMKRKRIYELTNKSDDHRLLLATIEQIRKEAEGDLIRIDADISLNIQGTIEERMKGDILRHMSVMEIILSRVSSKTGANPIVLIQSISKSYYNTVIASPVEERNTDFPSTQTYDFDRMTRINEARVEQQLIQLPAAQIAPETEKKAIDIKALLLAKIKAKNGDLNLAKNNLIGMTIDHANG